MSKVMRARRCSYFFVKFEDNNLLHFDRLTNWTVKIKNLRDQTNTKEIEHRAYVTRQRRNGVLLLVIKE